MRKRLLFVIAAVLVVAGGAFAQSVIYDFFNTEDSDTRSVEIFYAPSDSDEPNNNDINVSDNTFAGDPDEVLANVDYDAILPSDLPDGYTIDSADYRGNQSYLAVEYRCGRHWGFMVVQRPMSPELLSSLPPQNVGASAEILEVQLNDAVGQYVKGSWMIQRDEPLSEEEPRADVTSVWDNEAAFHRLAWAHDGRYFMINSSAGILSTDGHEYPCELSTDDVLAMGRSMMAD